MLIKVKNLISNKKFMMISKIVLGVIVLFIIAVSSYLILNKKDNTKKNENETVDVGENITISQDKTSLIEGEEYQLEVTKEEDTTVTWSSSDESIATVENGSVKGIKEGSVTIIATTNTGKTASINITITKKNEITPPTEEKPPVNNTVAVTSIKINESTKDLSINSTQQYTATLSPSNATTKTVTWSSNNESVAEVSSSGLVTTKNAGTVTITAKTSNGKTTTTNINVTIPNSCFTMSGTKITGYSTSASCKTTAMNIPASLGVTEIGNAAFWGRNLVSLSIPNSVTNIDDNPFGSNSTLQSITVDSNNPNYKSINNAIYTKDGKKLITGTKGMANNIEPTITSIGHSAFLGMQLTSITIPNSVTTIERSAFYSNQLTSVTIPSGITTIENQAFQYNQLTSINISNNVTSIGNNPFGSNSTLQSITVDSNNPNYKSINNAIYTKDGTKLITGTKGMANNIEPTITKIEYSAFFGMQLTSVTIPNSVTIIGTGAFNLNQLTSVTIPSGVTTIENSAFYGNQLTSINIPNSVTSIESLAFYANNILQGDATIDNTSGAVTIASSAFNNNGSDRKTTITPVYLR